MSPQGIMSSQKASNGPVLSPAKGQKPSLGTQTGRGCYGYILYHFLRIKGDRKCTACSQFAVSFETERILEPPISPFGLTDRLHIYIKIESPMYV